MDFSYPKIKYIEEYKKRFEVDGKYYLNHSLAYPDRHPAEFYTIQAWCACEKALEKIKPMLHSKLIKCKIFETKVPESVERIIHKKLSPFKKKEWYLTDYTKASQMIENVLSNYTINQG